jgi:interferon gamma-inducible protein 30
MKLKFLLFSSFLLTLISSQSPYITIYIESLCPDCTEFISNSFKEFYNLNITNLATIDFIPFGNANETYNETTELYEFSCQHGENECFGNIIETCAINIMGKYLSSGLLICIEENIFESGEDFEKVLKNCTNDEELSNQILSCTGDKTGNTWEHHMAQKTEAHDYVPWVIVDGIHDVDAENKILNNLTDYLCNLPGKTCSSKKIKYYDERMPF